MYRCCVVYAAHFSRLFERESNFVMFAGMANCVLKASKNLLLFFVQCMMNWRFDGGFSMFQKCCKKSTSTEVESDCLGLRLAVA